MGIRPIDTTSERNYLERALGMESGYVLDFSDGTFNDFFYETIGVDPEERAQLFSSRGTSKAKRLRSFIERGEPSTVGMLLREMWEYRESLEFHASLPDEEKIRDSFFSTVARIEGRSDANAEAP